MSDNQDIKCPECGQLISFKNMMMFEPKEVKILGISYALKCMKCKTVFIPNIRMSKKASKEDIEKIKQQMEKVGNK